jgi:hypothetical protein
MRKCPYPDCEEDIASSKFACLTHWFGLPRGLRECLMRALDAHNNDPRAIAPADALKHAQADAMAYWTSK